MPALMYVLTLGTFSFSLRRPPCLGRRSWMHVDLGTRLGLAGVSCFGACRSCYMSGSGSRMGSACVWVRLAISCREIVRQAWYTSILVHVRFASVSRIGLVGRGVYHIPRGFLGLKSVAWVRADRTTSILVHVWASGLGLGSPVQGHPEGGGVAGNPGLYNLYIHSDSDTSRCACLPMLIYTCCLTSL